MNDQLGNVSQMQYDALDRQTKTINAIGGQATVVSDNNSNQIETVDENGNSTTYNYDTLDRLANVTDDMGETTHILYNANSNVIK